MVSFGLFGENECSLLRAVFFVLFLFFSLTGKSTAQTTAEQSESRTARKLHAFYENLDYDKALDFARGRKLDTESKFVLALCQTELNRPAEALSLMDEVLSEAPENIEYRFFAAAVYSTFGKDRKALRCINRVLEHERKGTSYLTKAEILLSLGRKNEALRVLDTAAAFPLTEVTAKILEASVYAERDDHGKALEVLNKLLKRRGIEADDFYTLRYNAALSYFFSGQYDKAYARFSELYNENTEDYDALSRLIQVANRSQDYRRADSLRLLMYAAYHDDKIPESMQGMFCIDHYMNDGRQVVVMERFGEAFGLNYKHIFYLLDDNDNPELSVQTEHNFTLEQKGKKYALGKTNQKGEHFMYFQFSYEETPSYPKLKADVNKVLSGKAQPDTSTRYTTDEEAERAAGKDK